MKTIKVLGRSDEKLKIVYFGKELNNFRVSDAVQFATDRSSANYHYISDLQDDDVVELIFEDDIHRWVTLKELEREYKYSIPRGETPAVIEIPSQLPSSGTSQTTRGATVWALKALRVLKFDPMRTAAKGIANVWDKKLMPSPGLYRIAGPTLRRAEEVLRLQATRGRPILLFLHGTFSSTEGSFGKLPLEIVLKLQQRYGDRIFGYDHATLSLSPIQNAIDLVGKLPQNATLHLVTHSRGGLIGELLSRQSRIDGKAMFDEDDVKLTAGFEQTPHGTASLTQLAELMKSKNIRVEKFVRIACPARGTTIASGRIDRWLEVIVNVLAKSLDATTGNVIGVLTDLLLELKRQAANPQAIPGLAAMIPDSSFIRMINRPDVEVGVDLCVIAGDVEKNDILGRLAIFFTDLFYYEDHDLVVQTRAMYGGGTSKNGVYFLHKGSEVNHFHYFANRKTAEKIAEALLSDQTALTRQGFRPISEAYRDAAVPDIDLVSRSYQKRSNVSQPVVYILPGIMGTHLAENGRPIWLNLFNLARGGLATLQVSNRNIQPYALVSMAYGKLVDYLSATHEVIPFPYDWRLSILNEAERFGQVLDAKLKDTKQPIRIVAHSMGGLITRAMISLRPDVWESICQRPGSRFVMLGTPNKGAHKAIRLILGQDSMVRMLALLDFKNSPEQLLEVITRFPGTLQLLPMDDTLWDFEETITWSKFPSTGRHPWVKPLQPDLDEVKKFQIAMSGQKFSDNDPVAYVAGFAPGAPMEVELSEQGDVVFRATDEGDGTVTWVSGILPELQNRTWYMNAAHGDMANQKESFAAIYELLQEGTTARLSKVPPRVSRGVEDTYILPPDQAEIYPTQADLEQTVLGATQSPLQVSAKEPVKVSVAHGNLAFCSNPVAVGHYEGDGLFSAEKDLDHHLNGRLSARHMLGLYPGMEGTAEVILNDGNRKPGGAIIVGLGQAGELSPHKLSQSFANAMREFAIKAVENKMLGEDENLAVSTLLIGAGGMGLSVANSVDAILSGVTQANKSFSLAPDLPVRISEIQFIELFKDQAILAARALQTYADKPEFAVDPLLRPLRGGFQRLVYEEPAGWWSRIFVRAGENSSLIFTLPTERARSEESQLGVQGSSIENLIAQAVRDPKWDQGQATAIFELMIPNRLKGSFRDLSNVLFVLDPEAAHYPWELLYDRRTGEDKPLVVQVGMIRQFSTSTFQERVVDVRNRKVLVVGNPANTPEGFANLPGAEQEASLVAAKFNEYKYEVIPQINTGSNAIMNSLFANDYRVLHLAGHGVYRFPVLRPGATKPELYTGMVLGDGIFLTANEIKNKMEIPELVFVNCCHLGTIDAPAGSAGDAFNEFAASLSEELIEMGVKAVIAAGWAVDDAAAITFADVFYNRLLQGAEFGAAVLTARQETYELHKEHTNTWAAYQCYGDPSYRLVMAREEGRSDTEKFVYMEEAYIEIKKLSSMTRTTSVQGLNGLRDRVVNLEQKIAKESPEWLEDSTIQEAFGEVYAEVFWFDQATQYYERAIKNRSSSVSIRAVEQLANCRIRLAVQNFQTDPSYYKEARGIIETQLTGLSLLTKAIGETVERMSIVGSAYKRLAQISSSKSPKACDLALKQMEAAYDLAHTSLDEDPYPLTNALLAKTIRLLRSGNQEEIKTALPALFKLKDEAARLAAIQKSRAPDDFWASIGTTDVDLVGFMLSYMKNPKTINEAQFDELVNEYKETWVRYGSARELNSIIEHYAFLATVLGDSSSHKRLHRWIEKVLLSLTSISE